MSNIVYIGVTGTNGKTTITWLINHLLLLLNQDVLLIGTLGAYFNGNFFSSLRNTTPSNEVIRDLVSQCSEKVTATLYVVLEVSSIGLHQDRVQDINFNVGVFSNLTPDHLDYHPNMEAYFNEKLKLFKNLERTQDAFAVINNSCAFGQKILILLGNSVQPIAIDRTENILVAYFKKQLIDHPIRERFVGEYNLTNLLQACLVVSKLLTCTDEVVRVLHDVPSVPGRLNRYDVNGVDVIIDYAHTPDGLQKVLEGVREICKGKLFCVFGCGGDRYKSKRSVMGRIAEQYSDVQIVTSDNPRTEDPEGIIDQIISGFENPENAIRIVERKEAIVTAVGKLAKVGDTVLLAGKGHEDYQITGTQRLPFSEVNIIHEMISHSSKDKENDSPRSVIR